MGGSLGKSESGSSSNNQFSGSSSDRSSTQNDIRNWSNNNIGSNAYDVNNAGSKTGASSKGDSGANQNVWGSQGDALSNLYGGVGGALNSGDQRMDQQVNQGIDVQQNAMNQMQPAWQNQMQGGAYANLGVGNQLMDSLNQSQNTPSNMQQVNSMIMGGEGNNYADAMRDQYVSDANQAQNNMMQNMDARAAASGMSGGARHGMAMAQGNKDINENLQRNMANVGYNSFDKDLDRKLNIAQQADMNNFGRQQMMQEMLGSQQNTMNTGMDQGGNMLNYGNQQQMQPWQQLGAAGQVIGGPTVLDNSYDRSTSDQYGNTYDTGRSGSSSYDTSSAGGYDQGSSKSTGKSSQQGSGSGASSSKGLGLGMGK